MIDLLVQLLLIVLVIAGFWAGVAGLAWVGYRITGSETGAALFVVIGASLGAGLYGYAW